MRPAAPLAFFPALFHFAAFAVFAVLIVAAPLDARAQTLWERAASVASDAADLAVDAGAAAVGAAEEAAGGAVDWTEEQLYWALDEGAAALAAARQRAADSVAGVIEGNREFLNDCGRMGFRVQKIIVGVSVIPSVTVRFVDVGATGEEDAVLAEYADRPAHRLALQTLLTARQMRVAGFEASEVWVTLTPTPRAQVVLSLDAAL